MMLFVPEAKLAAGNTGINIVESIVTDGAPDSVVFDLQTTFTLHGTADKPQLYNRSCHSTTHRNAGRRMRKLITGAKGQLDVWCSMQTQHCHMCRPRLLH